MKWSEMLSKSSDEKSITSLCILVKARLLINAISSATNLLIFGLLATFRYSSTTLLLSCFCSNHKISFFYNFSLISLYIPVMVFSIASTLKSS